MKYETHSQASKEKEIFFIDLARVDSYYNVPLEMRNKMLEISKAKKKKCDSMNIIQDISKEQKVNSFTKSIKIIEKIKSGKRRGKPRLASDITMIQLKKPVTETQTMTASKFTRRAQILYTIEEILTLMQSSFNKEEELEISRITLMTLKKIEDVKIKLRKALGRPDSSGRSFDNTIHFKVQSEKSKAIGGSKKLLVWNDDLEKDIEQQ